MQYLIIAREIRADFEKRTDTAAFKAYMDPWFAYGAMLTEAGVIRGGEALELPETATCVSASAGGRRIEDGPFADAKEQIGGFFLIDVATRDEAVAWALKCPSAETGCVEVRGVPDYSA